MRILLSLVVVLSGLLMAREFMAHSNEQVRLTLRGAKVVTEQNIATVREPPAQVAPTAVARIAEVSAPTLATVRVSRSAPVPIVTGSMTDEFDPSLVKAATNDPSGRRITAIACGGNVPPAGWV